MTTPTLLFTTKYRTALFACYRETDRLAMMTVTRIGSRNFRCVVSVLSGVNDHEDFYFLRAAMR